MPQNGCGRDRPLAWIFIPMPKFFPLKWGILASVTRTWPNRCRKCPIFGHVLVTDVEGKNEMGYFGIGMHIHASGLSLPQPFWGIWQPSRNEINCNVLEDFCRIFLWSVLRISFWLSFSLSFLLLVDRLLLQFLGFVFGFYVSLGEQALQLGFLVFHTG